MKLKAWREHPYHILHPDVKTAIRDGEFRIPSNDARRSFPAIRMIVTNNHGMRSDDGYEVYLEDSEYSIKTSWGEGFESFEQAKFVADLRLIELGYDIEEPFLLGDKND